MKHSSAATFTFHCADDCRLARNVVAVGASLLLRDECFAVWKGGKERAERRLPAFLSYIPSMRAAYIRRPDLISDWKLLSNAQGEYKIVNIIGVIALAFSVLFGELRIPHGLCPFWQCAAARFQLARFLLRMHISPFRLSLQMKYGACFRKFVFRVILNNTVFPHLRTSRLFQF